MYSLIFAVNSLYTQVSFSVHIKTVKYVFTDTADIIISWAQNSFIIAICRTILSRRFLSSKAVLISRSAIAIALLPE
jgi:hypothetical protein